MNQDLTNTNRTKTTKLLALAGISAALALAAAAFINPVEATGKQTPTAARPSVSERTATKLKESDSQQSLAAAVTAARYRVEAVETGAVARNDAHDLQMNFGGDGWQLQSTVQEKSWTSKWRLSSFGYGGEQTEAAEGQWHTSGNRTELRREEQGITEWFVIPPKAWNTVSPSRRGRARRPTADRCDL